MRVWKIAFSVFILGCSSSGTQASLEGGLDATNPASDATTDGGDDGDDGGDASDAPFVPCFPVIAVTPQPSQDCVFAGPCPANCLVGSASEYFCSASRGLVDAAPQYPSVFAMPTGVINVVGTVATAYPWDAAAWASCAPLSCVRWATGDHANGTSAAPGDPCADGGDAVEAWSCPQSPGVVPPPAGCFRAGPLEAIGDPEGGVPTQNVWCCPSTSGGGGGQDDAGSDGGIEEGGEEDGGDAAPSDATLPDGSGDGAPDAGAPDSGAG